MRFSGVVPPDAPDPREQRRARVRELGFPVFGLVPQQSVEDYGAVSLVLGGGEHSPDHRAVGVSYTLWRNPDDRGDPANLADLDPATRASLDSEPPWPRPEWLLESVERMRYRQLWEAVRTSWHREDSEWSRLDHQLIAHAEHILMNRYRAELHVPPGPPGDGPWRIHPSAVQEHATLTIDGKGVDAVAIDTDPFVYAIGARIDPRTAVSVVLPRDELPHVEVALQTRADG